MDIISQRYSFKISQIRPPARFQFTLYFEKQVKFCHDITDMVH